MIELENYKSGVFQKTSGYSYFNPTEVNDQWTWLDPQINNLLEKASVHLGELNAYAKLVPNIDLFIQLHVTKEAVVSSKIEGTQTNLDEAMMPENEIRPDRKQDWQEVQNYILAMNHAIQELEMLPISSRLLRKAHAILLNTVRGEDKLPGEFRTSQNWIGGRSISDAIFIPPHKDFVQSLMGDLENFLHNEYIDVPKLVRIAIAHYQFETIHPFLDGNGRIGRLLITLYLVSEKVLYKPLLYLSTFFEEDKGLYYDNLMRVRTHHDISHWIKYFLVGVAQTANEAVKTLTQVMKFKEQIESEVNLTFGKRSGSAYVLLQYLFRKPILTVDDAQRECQLSYKAANDLIRLMTDKGHLVEITGQRRGRMFSFDEYLRIFRKN